MSQDLDQLSNEDLDALAATEIMGWRRKLVFTGLESGEAPIFWWQDTAETLIYNTTAWCPAAEGHEHQAMMIVRKMTADRWDFNLFTPRDRDDRGSIAWFGRRDGVLAVSDKTTGRAIVLAALKAKGDGG